MSVNFNIQFDVNYLWFLPMSLQVIDDPTGNSFIENPNAPHKDEQLIETHYVRTHQQDIDIGAAVMTLADPIYIVDDSVTVWMISS